MNYLENMRKRHEAAKSRYKRLCLVALIFGLLAGFLSGVITCRVLAASPTTAPLERETVMDVTPIPTHIQLPVLEVERALAITPIETPEPAKKKFIGYIPDHRLLFL